jgi:hypothetical protein
MKYPKIDPAKSQAGQVSEHREPYEPPTVTVVPLKIEERLLACGKALGGGGQCNHLPGVS